MYIRANFSHCHTSLTNAGSLWGIRSRGNNPHCAEPVVSHTRINSPVAVLLLCNNIQIIVWLQKVYSRVARVCKVSVYCLCFSFHHWKHLVTDLILLGKHYIDVDGSAATKKISNFQKCSQKKYPLTVHCFFARLLFHHVIIEFTPTY